MSTDPSRVVLTPDTSEIRYRFDPFIRKAVHGFISACCCVDLTPRSSELLTSARLGQSIVFPIDQEAYSANPIPPFEQPVTRTTLDSSPADMVMGWVSSESSDLGFEGFVEMNRSARSHGRSAFCLSVCARGYCPGFPEGSSWEFPALMDWIPGVTFRQICYELTGTHKLSQ